MVKRCASKTVSGSPCSATPVRPSGYCYWHDPALSADRDAARKRGGANRSNKARARKHLPAELMTNDEVRAWLGVVFKRVIAGVMEPGVATAAGSVARAMVAVKQAGELEERLTALEERAGLTDKWRA
jgi:hypothetical protein